MVVLSRNLRQKCGGSGRKNEQEDTTKKKKNEGACEII